MAHYDWYLFKRVMIGFPNRNTCEMQRQLICLNYRPRTKYDGRLCFQFVCQSTGGRGGGTLLTGPWSQVPSGRGEEGALVITSTGQVTPPLPLSTPTRTRTGSFPPPTPDGQDQDTVLQSPSPQSGPGQGSPLPQDTTRYGQDTPPRRRTFLLITSIVSSKFTFPRLL